ncbi:unnamed protein product [Didymodactylos carnosus]|uniref:Uncharacterized protein n=1 Tax=Didymodactylos carnosus TaxID=1234261 RepID=A0A8S2FM51_9BILA|nr:unnamed protein product [Didymodactylos carnosus]CAF4284194.1 unnamed protein product [Didymodactylos carnosus]
MHLVCLGHVLQLIKRWCKLLIKQQINELDKQLQAIQLPHNMNVIYLDSTLMSDQWKAKTLVASHFVLYAMVIKLLHCPKTPEEITLAEQLIDRYCEQAPLVYDQRIELLTLHAHLHLADQAQLHGGLAFTYAYSFKSSIRFIKRKAHGKQQIEQSSVTPEIQHLVIDNSFSIVKQKQCQKGLHEGMVMVKSGSKTYSGVIAHTGKDILDL